MEPLYRALNRVVKTMVGLGKIRYRVADNYRDMLFADVQDHYARTGEIPVWGGASDNTVFASAPINHAFRAWHDHVHIGLRLGFDLLSESRVCEYQTRSLLRLPWLSAVQRRVCGALLHTEIVEQARYYDRTGAFPVDQLGFARRQLQTLGITL